MKRYKILYYMHQSRHNGDGSSTGHAEKLDGAWQKRGHSSVNGVGTSISMDNGKVIVFEASSPNMEPSGAIKNSEK